MPVAKVNSIDINYTVTGQGEPLVMIMGLTATQSGWKPQIPYFKKHFQVITFDNRGIGRSSKPQGPYSIRMMADDTIGLMDYLHIEKAHILGISMGGMIAQEIAINYPSRVMKLILASTYCCEDKKLNGSTLEMAKALKSPSRKAGKILIQMAFNNPFNRFTLSFQSRLRSKFIRISDSVKAEIKNGVKSQLGACLIHNTLDRLSSIQSPTLVIAGSRDRIIKPSSSEVIAGKIPHVRRVEVKNGSHSLNVEKKHIFNREVLHFLKNS